MNPIQPQNIPEELRNLPQWVCWRAVPKIDKNGDEKMDKEPFVASGKYRASSTDPKTWCDFATALDAYNDESRGFAGIGFVFTVESGIVGLDFDHCIHDGIIGDVTAADKRKISALEIVESLGTYTEVSPSGDGLHAFCFGVKPGSASKRGDVEMYNKGRFFTVTGDRVGSIDSLAQCDLTGVYEAFFGADEPEAQAPPPPPSEPLDMSDADILKLACASKNGGHFSALYAGNWQAFYNSHSEADSALCFYLAFWFQRDPFAMDRVFRTSGLMRAKWDEARGDSTIGKITIDGACSKVTNVYTPKKAKRNDGYEKRDARPGNQKADEESINEGLYVNLNGRTLYSVSKVKETGAGSTESAQGDWICDWTYKVVGEIHSEDGVTTCQIEGTTHSGRPFAFTATQDQISDPRTFSRLCRSAVGSGFVMYSGKERHLAPALDTFTDVSQIKHSRQFARTGWTDNGEFLIDGLLPSDAVINLPRELAYGVQIPTPDQNELVTELLDGLFIAHDFSVSTLSVAFALLAPLARLCGWQDEKFVLFLAGRSGTFKTSFAQMVMSIYGDFGHDDKLLRFGSGGTANALMTYPAMACDLPLGIDNFKPETGGGQKAAQTLVHGLIEGTERKRCNQDGTLKASRELGAWMVFTGEDTVSDAASVARMIICEVRYEGNDNPSLTWIQERSHQLPLIGGAWLSWLVEGGDELQSVIKAAKARLGERRGKWVSLLRRANEDMINAFRVASSLAELECFWDVASVHPIFGASFKKLRGVYIESLEKHARGMAQASAESHEAIRFINAIKAMVEGGEGVLLERYKDPDAADRRAVLGWQDDEFIYLSPDLAFAAALKFLAHQNGLNGVSPLTVWRQLDQLEYLAAKDGAHMAPKRRLGEAGKKRVLVIPRTKIFDDEESE